MAAFLKFLSSSSKIKLRATSHRRHSDWWFLAIWASSLIHLISFPTFDIPYLVTTDLFSAILLYGLDSGDIGLSVIVQRVLCLNRGRQCMSIRPTDLNHLPESLPNCQFSGCSGMRLLCYHSSPDLSITCNSVLLPSFLVYMADWQSDQCMSMHVVLLSWHFCI